MSITLGYILAYRLNQTPKPKGNSVCVHSAVEKKICKDQTPVEAKVGRRPHMFLAVGQSPPSPYHEVGTAPRHARPHIT